MRGSFSPSGLVVGAPGSVGSAGGAGSFGPFVVNVTLNQARAARRALLGIQSGESRAPHSLERAL